MKVLPYLLSLEKKHEAGLQVKEPGSPPWKLLWPSWFLDLVIVSKDVFMFIPDPPRTIFPSCQATILNWMRINDARDLHDKYDQSSQPKTQIPPKKNKKKNISRFFSAGISLFRTGYFFQWFLWVKRWGWHLPWIFTFYTWKSRNWHVNFWGCIPSQKRSRGMSLQWRVKDHHRRFFPLCFCRQTRLRFGQTNSALVEESYLKLIQNSVSGIAR